jgi:hypothetical protein
MKPKKDSNAKEVQPAETKIRVGEELLKKEFQIDIKPEDQWASNPSLG